MSREELRILTIDYSCGHAENILFNTKQAAAILDELPELVEHGSWEIRTITDCRLDWLDQVEHKNDQILIAAQHEEIKKLTTQLEEANQLIAYQKKSITEWAKAGKIVGLTRKAGME